MIDVHVFETARARDAFLGFHGLPRDAARIKAWVMLTADDASERLRGLEVDQAYWHVGRGAPSLWQALQSRLRRGGDIHLPSHATWNDALAASVTKARTELDREHHRLSGGLTLPPDLETYAQQLRQELAQALNAIVEEAHQVQHHYSDEEWSRVAPIMQRHMELSTHHLREALTRLYVEFGVQRLMAVSGDIGIALTFSKDVRP